MSKFESLSLQRKTLYFLSTRNDSPVSSHNLNCATNMAHWNPMVGGIVKDPHLTTQMCFWDCCMGFPTSVHTHYQKMYVRMHVQTVCVCGQLLVLLLKSRNWQHIYVGKSVVGGSQRPRTSTKKKLYVRMLSSNNVCVWCCQNAAAGNTNILVRLWFGFPSACAHPLWKKGKYVCMYVMFVQCICVLSVAGGVVQVPQLVTETCLQYCNWLYLPFCAVFYHLLLVC